MKKVIPNLVRVFVLLLLLFAGQFFPAKTQYNVKAAGSSQANASSNSLPLILQSSPALPGSTTIFLPLIMKNYIPPAPLWRFGTGQVRNPITAYDSSGIAAMRFGWYVNFGVTSNAPTPYGMEYVPVVRVKQLKLAADLVTQVSCCVDCGYVDPPIYSVTPTIAQITAMAKKQPGLTWLVGNEMDRVDATTSDGYCMNQDEMLPEVYAQAYHDIYIAIKAADPTAQVAIGAMVEFTDLRRQYLQRVWDEYKLLFGVDIPVDIWNIHLYVLQEKSCLVFPADCWGADVPAGFPRDSASLEQYSILDNNNFTIAWNQIVSLRTWMKDHGQQNKPLIISEYGVLWPSWVECPAYPDTTGCPFTPEQVRDTFMYPSFDKFLNYTDATLGFPADGNRYVQRWNWFSIDYDYGRCDTGVPYGGFGGYLFNSGLGLSDPSTGCSSPPLGIAPLGTYWKQYVQGLPADSGKPYTP